MRSPSAEPDEEPEPSLDRQAEHESAAKKHAEERKHWNERHPKRSRPVRILFAQHDDAGTNQSEGEEGPNIREVGQRTDVGQHRDTADEDARPDGGDVRGAKARVDPGKILRQQSVARHRHEDARLAELKDEQHRGESGQRSRADQRLRPGLPRKGRCHRGRIAEVSRVFLIPVRTPDIRT